MTEKDRENLGKLIEHLEGSSLNLSEDLVEGHDLPWPLTAEMTAAIDERIFECDGCGWWFERGDESLKTPGECKSCVPDEED